MHIHVSDRGARPCLYLYDCQPGQRLTEPPRPRDVHFTGHLVTVVTSRESYRLCSILLTNGRPVREIHEDVGFRPGHSRFGVEPPVADRPRLTLFNQP